MNQTKTNTMIVVSDNEIARGKTKRILSLVDNDVQVAIESLDDITAGDGAKHDQITGKAISSNITTCNVFRLLEEKNIQTAFQQQIDSRRFMASFCQMIPLEVVVRRVALGSYLKRNPDVEKGHVFDDLVVEFFLKTNNKNFRGMKFNCDDPLLHHDKDVFRVHNPAKEFSTKSFLATVPTFLVVPEFDSIVYVIKEIAEQTFMVLEEAWRKLGYTLADFKIEFGFDYFGDLVVADVIDNDSWRVLDTKGEHVDKQLYRDGKDLQSVKGMYEKVAQLTNSFVS